MKLTNILTSLAYIMNPIRSNYKYNYFGYRPAAQLGHKTIWVGQTRIWVGHGLPGLIARTATGGTCLRFMTHGRLVALFITGNYRMCIPDPDWYHVHESRNVIIYKRMARTNVSVRRLQSLKWKFQN